MVAVQINGRVLDNGAICCWLRPPWSQPLNCTVSRTALSDATRLFDVKIVTCFFPVSRTAPGAMMRYNRE
jgi:hypothetical protein